MCAVMFEVIHKYGIYQAGASLKISGGGKPLLWGSDGNDPHIGGQAKEHFRAAKALQKQPHSAPPKPIAKLFSFFFVSC